MLRSRQACIAVADAVARKGGTLRLARARPGARDGRMLGDVRLDDGSVAAAGRFVFACGPWLPRLLPDLLGGVIRTPRRDVFFVGTPPGDGRFLPPALPNFSEAAYYGFPSIDYRGVKVCPTGEPTEIDPDVDERLVAPVEVKRLRDYLARRFPLLRDQPIVETRVCQLENTADEHFLIDRHPEFDNVWLAGGGSGHGFKHGPVVGEHIARLALGERPEPEYDEIFTLRRSGR